MLGPATSIIIASFIIMDMMSREYSSIIYIFLYFVKLHNFQQEHKEHKLGSFCDPFSLSNTLIMMFINYHVYCKDLMGYTEKLIKNH